MDEKSFDQTVERLKKVNEVIAGLDEAIRADAFSVLKPYVTDGGGASAESEDDLDGATANDAGAQKPVTGFDVLIEKHESHKDSENAMLALAIFYGRHGRGPFQLSQIKAVADEFNLTVPKRIDNFFARAKRDGKDVVRKQSDGWKVVPYGDEWLKTTYNVTRGKLPVA
jgi:hypothetical protein